MNKQIKTETKIYILGGLLTLAIIIGGIFLFQPEKEGFNQSSSSKNELIPTNEITHAHGLAVDVADANKLYIATHHGLLLLQNEKELYQIGESKDDYMGFSPHPTNSKIFFSSGHPSRGGNIGFQKSEDGGFTWKKVSDGVNGPVDFHAMAVSPVNPDLILGSGHGGLQRSVDGGENWKIVENVHFPIVSLAADPKDENVLYAASPLGLMVSTNKGEKWENLIGGFVSVIAVHPKDSQKLLSYSEQKKLAKSNDAGKTWETIAADFGGETPLYISFNKQSPDTIYLLTEKNSIYKSSDEGSTWEKIR
jgi:photosystem II stability/assembly factor-like uncharacterized protein